ncbi:MAG: DEAD/DEAH box helicase [Planctomycetes bacterium]|nr:DEAD/DEAH box helicase [Planctomycetota bacterium]
MRSAWFDAVYLHTRRPDDARIAFFCDSGVDSIADAFPAEVAAALVDVDVEILLPTEEESLAPLTPTGFAGKHGAQRLSPALWRIPTRALPLRIAVPLLAAMSPERSRPGISFLSTAARLALAMLKRGDFAPADGGGLVTHVPVWTDASLRCLAAVAELVPGILRTARIALEDDPVYAVSARNLALSLVGFAIDACAEGHHPRHANAERVPSSFHESRPQPAVEVLVPENPLEEGSAWAVQLSMRPVPGLPIGYPLEDLHQRLSQDLFPDPLALQSLARVEEHLDEIGRRVPAIHRAMNMAGGRAALDRKELDQLLDHLTLLESEGCAVTLPGVERLQRLSAIVSLSQLPETAGETRPWFDFRWSLAVGDRKLDDREFQELVESKAPVVFLDRGPVLLTKADRDALIAFSKRDKDEGTKISFFEAIRLKLAGATHLHGLALERLEGGERLEELVQSLEQARSVEERATPPQFIGELRAYQRRGHAWVHFLVDQGFGACLADDMGLGKTVQAIAVILDWLNARPEHGTILLVCPVSVLGNWRREVLRFAPVLRTLLHHGKSRASTPEEFAAAVSKTDIMLTSFNLLQRDSELFLSRTWEGVILDEAQNIKNPNTQQSKAARDLRGNFRLALTGTPLENRPLDLWSIMDFLNQGLLSTRANFLQTLEHPIVKQRSKSSASTLGRLVRPFVLRRLKTDPEIVTDLPETSEQVVAANLTREQAVLYEAVVRKGLREVELAKEGIQRRGAILTTLLRLKQVCNHPAHYLADGSSLANRSGKLDLLTEMIEEALEEGDRCLVFTQFKEMGTLLKTHVEEVIGSQVLFLHGGVPQKDREDMVARFQDNAPDGPRVFVLSLKAGGTGLNLTAANRVFHFDRWWNPAVEDQATDRAFRIGQQRNVFVHKFVCIGTLEERIQAMLERKREVANALLGAGEQWLTELSNEELRRLIILDRREALT